MRRKRKQAEDAEAYHQEAAAAYLDALGVLWAHPPNGAHLKGGARSGAKLKAAGMKPGLPDILIFDRAPRLISELNEGGDIDETMGTAIELKRPADRPKTLDRFERLTCSVVTPGQRKWLDRLDAAEWSVWVCFGVQEVVEVCQWLGYDTSRTPWTMPQGAK